MGRMDVGPNKKLVEAPSYLRWYKKVKFMLRKGHKLW
jgi:hypothetical protein